VLKAGAGRDLIIGEERGEGKGVLSRTSHPDPLSACREGRRDNSLLVSPYEGEKDIAI